MGKCVDEGGAEWLIETSAILSRSIHLNFLITISAKPYQQKGKNRLEEDKQEKNLKKKKEKAMWVCG